MARTPSSETVSRVAFVLSVVVFAFLYGFAAQRWDLFPKALLERAGKQARTVAPWGLWPPHFFNPRVYDREGVRRVDPDAMQPGATLVGTWWEDFGWNPGLKLIDEHGRALHEWRIEPSEIFPPELRDRGGRWKDLPGLAHRAIIGTHLFDDGDVLVNVEHVGTARLDACGRVEWRLPAGSHHSITRAEDGSFWIPGGRHDVAPETPDRPDGLPGIDGPIHQFQLLHVSEEGDLLQTISVLDVLYRNDLQRYFIRGSHNPHPADPKRGDLTHLNHVEALGPTMAGEYPLFDAGDLAVSLRNIDLVLVVDPATLQVKWHATLPFIGPHDPDFMGDGWIGVFDNNRDGTERGNMLGGSRIVALQPHTDSTRVLFPTPRSEPFYTAGAGRWQMLGNGNLLLTESFAGRIVEVAPDGRTVWEWVSGSWRGEMVPDVQEGTRYDLTADAVAAWPCSPGEAAAD